MKPIFQLLVTCSFALGAIGAARAARSDAECIGKALDTGSFLYGNIGPGIKYSTQCIIAEGDGAVSVAVLRADAPVEVEAKRKGVVLGDNVRWQWGKRIPVSREFVFDVRRGDRIDLRMDGYGPRNLRHGEYVLLVSSDALDDPNRFAALGIMDSDTMKMRYASPEILFQPIMLAPAKTLRIYIPYVDSKPHLRFTPVGLDPAQLIVGTIDLATGQSRIVDFRDGFFHIPAIDPDGMVLSIASKASTTTSAKLSFRTTPEK